MMSLQGGTMMAQIAGEGEVIMLDLHVEGTQPRQACLPAIDEWRWRKGQKKGLGVKGGWK